MPRSETSRRMPTKITVGFAAVIVLGLGTFVLAAGTFSTRLRAPFGMSSSASGKDLTDSNSPEVLLTDTKDTDRDGVPDAQELQVYRTSPFLEDTDSDGASDREEIASGGDPNCPQGQDCRTLAFPSAREFEQQEITRK